MKNILILNGSPQGNKGNCHKLIRQIQKVLKGQARSQVLHLAQDGYSKSFKSHLKQADSVIFVTGTYWDSWGSPLQKLLEDMTELEGSDLIVGKPCAVFVLMHSVGGKSVLSRLQGVLSTLGFLIPPMSGMVYSLVSDLALKNSSSTHADDFWSLTDVEIILGNLFLAQDLRVKWISWPVERENFRRIWLK